MTHVFLAVAEDGRRVETEVTDASEQAYKMWKYGKGGALDQLPDRRGLLIRFYIDGEEQFLNC